MRKQFLVIATLSTWHLACGRMRRLSSLDKRWKFICIASARRWRSGLLSAAGFPRFQDRQRLVYHMKPSIVHFTSFSDTLIGTNLRSAWWFLSNESRWTMTPRWIDGIPACAGGSACAIKRLKNNISSHNKTFSPHNTRRSRLSCRDLEHQSI